MWSESTLISGLVAILVAVLAPYAAEKIRQRSQGRRDDASVTMHQMDGQRMFYGDLQARLGRIEAENDELGQQVLDLQRVVNQWEVRFAAIADDLERIRTALEAERPEVQTAVTLLVQMLERIRRREDVREEAG